MSQAEGLGSAPAPRRALTVLPSEVLLNGHFEWQSRTMT